MNVWNVFLWLVTFYFVSSISYNGSIPSITYLHIFSRSVQRYDNPTNWFSYMDYLSSFMAFVLNLELQFIDQYKFHYCVYTIFPRIVFIARIYDMQYILWGVKDHEVHVNFYIGPRAQSKEKPLLGHGKNPPRHGCRRGRRGQPAIGSDTPGHSTEQKKY